MQCMLLIFLWIIHCVNFCSFVMFIQNVITQSFSENDRFLWLIQSFSLLKPCPSTMDCKLFHFECNVHISISNQEPMELIKLINWAKFKLFSAVIKATVNLKLFDLTWKILKIHYNISSMLCLAVMHINCLVHHMQHHIIL